MENRATAASPIASPGGQAPDGATARWPRRASGVASVVLLDYVAGFLCFVAAGGYVILKVLNDRHGALGELIDEAARWALLFGFELLPGMPDYPSLRLFAAPDFADAYLITMAAVHLLASAGFLALAYALATFQPWARWAHILIAGSTVLILVVYAGLTLASPAPRISLAVMALGAIVPAAVLAILLAPGHAALFAGDRLPPGASLAPADRRASQLPRLLIGAILAVFALGALATMAVTSVPIAIQIGRSLAPSD